ncbi:uncharacterized protein LOC141649743 [Silene latifolia]|uniref:uncharacterized protein LOC141649743 n=1 Tax=Silene latifolia TaxID=37657 RepID=UPI003D785A2D
MSNTSIRDSLKFFVEGVISCFGNEYLRGPNPQDLGRLLHMGQARGFPGMLGIIDCMHWSGKIVPQHGRDNMPGEVQRQLSFWKRRIRPPVNFSVNGTDYNKGYYLADGIYPGWATFVKTINVPQIQKHRLFAARQESCRKDVERAFGVLQARFAFIKRPCLFWDRANTGKVLMACIIMHNMIVEDEKETYLNYENIIAEFKEDNPTSASDDPYEYHRLRRSPQERFIEIHGEIRERATNNALKNDLIEHIWQNFRNSN